MPDDTNYRDLYAKLVSATENNPYDDDIHYKEMYFKMVNATEDAINAITETMSVLEQSMKTLIKAQLQCEKMYIDPEEDED